jgi:hypothetical protein
MMSGTVESKLREKHTAERIIFIYEFVALLLSIVGIMETMISYMNIVNQL